MSAEPVPAFEAVVKCQEYSKTGNKFVRGINTGEKCIYGSPLGGHCGHVEKATGHVRCCVCGLYEDPLLQAMHEAVKEATWSR